MTCPSVCYEGESGEPGKTNPSDPAPSLALSSMFCLLKLVFVLAGRYVYVLLFLSKGAQDFSIGMGMRNKKKSKEIGLNAMHQ